MDSLSKPAKNILRECLCRKCEKGEKDCLWLGCVFHINFSYSFSFERVNRVRVHSKPVLAKNHSRLVVSNQSNQGGIRATQC